MNKLICVEVEHEKFRWTSLWCTGETQFARIKHPKSLTLIDLVEWNWIIPVSISLTSFVISTQQLSTHSNAENRQNFPIASSSCINIFVPRIVGIGLNHMAAINCSPFRSNAQRYWNAITKARQCDENTRIVGIHCRRKTDCSKWNLKLCKNVRWITPVMDINIDWHSVAFNEILLSYRFASVIFRWKNKINRFPFTDCFQLAAFERASIIDNISSAENATTRQNHSEWQMNLHHRNHCLHCADCLLDHFNNTLCQSNQSTVYFVFQQWHSTHNSN